jgi:hypothetical protein
MGEDFAPHVGEHLHSDDSRAENAQERQGYIEWPSSHLPTTILIRSHADPVPYHLDAVLG